MPFINIRIYAPKKVRHLTAEQKAKTGLKVPQNYLLMYWENPPPTLVDY